MLKKLLVCTFCLGLLLPVTYAHAASEAKPEGIKEYVKLDPLLLPIIDEDGVQQVISLVVSIEVDTVQDADKVRSLKPRLADAYIQKMYGVLNRHAALKGGIVQVVMLKEMLNDITHKVVGDKIETAVLLQVVQQRPI